MSPRLMLSLWRERWGKAGDSASKRPCLEGRLNQWGDRLMAAQVWSLPGILKATILLTALGLGLLVTVDLSLNSQIVFAVLLAGISLYARRYGGPWVTLVLVGLSVIASARYLFWRFDATLSPHLDMALVLGFALCAGELHLWTLKMVDLLASAFALKSAPVPLPADPHDWPTVDVFIPCHGLSDASIMRSARAAQALDWPREKIKCYLLDDSPTETTRLLARSMDMTYWSTPDHDAGKIGCINQALPATQGEWIVVFGGDCTPDKGFLTRVAGWWVADPHLAMMQTARHFLVPAPSQRSLTVMEAPERGGRCAMIRRSMLLRAGGLAPEPVTPKVHTALKLQAMGGRIAYVGFSTPRSPDPNQCPRGSGASPYAAPALDVFRIDQPFSDTALYGKQCIGALQAMLQFYRLVPLMMVFMAPLAYLLAGVNVIQASSALFLAYFLPHWLQGYMAQVRFDNKNRLTVLDELKETALALCILCTTALSVTRTEGSRWLRFHQREKNQRPEPFDGLIAWSYALVLVLTLLGFISGLIQAALSAYHDRVAHDMTTLYLVWSGYNLLLLAAVLAVAQESRHIRWQTHRESRRPATVRLPSGRAILCETHNFPATSLTLQLPVPMVLDEGSPVNISIFRHDREFAFPARVVFSGDNALCVTIEKAGLTAYRALGAAIFSRGPDWPKWLPGRHADQPFPAWAIEAFGVVRTAMLNVKKRLGEFSWWVLVGGWMQGWKKR